MKRVIIRHFGNVLSTDIFSENNGKTPTFIFIEDGKLIVNYDLLKDDNSTTGRSSEYYLNKIIEAEIELWNTYYAEINVEVESDSLIDTAEEILYQKYNVDPSIVQFSTVECEDVCEKCGADAEAGETLCEECKEEEEED